MGWQVTATTIRCKRVDSFVVLMVYGDGRVRCNYFERHNVAKNKRKMLLNCRGQDCTALAEFKEHAFAI